MENEEPKAELAEPSKPIADTRDFIGFMGSMMQGVLNETVTTDKAKVVVAAGNVILRAMEINLEWSRQSAESPGNAMPLLLATSKVRP